MRSTPRKSTSPSALWPERTPLKVALALALLLGASSLAGQPIPAGIDCWTTDPSSSTISLPALPAGFFGTLNGVPSDPIPAQAVPVQGVPLAPGTCACQSDTLLTWNGVAHRDLVDPDNLHLRTQVLDPNGVYDTCVARLDTADFAGGVGVDDPVPVEMVELQLVNVDNQLINYGAQGPLVWRLDVGLSGPQTPGTFTFRPTNLFPHAGTMTETLPMGYDIDFALLGLPPPGLQGASVEPATGRIRVASSITLPSLSLDWQNGDGDFVSPISVVTDVPTLGTWSLALLALALGVVAVRGISRLM